MLLFDLLLEVPLSIWEVVEEERKPLPCYAFTILQKLLVIISIICELSNAQGD